VWTGPDFDAVILAGGSGRRLGGVDKAGLRIEGIALLDRVLAAVAGAQRIVVVGPRREDPARLADRIQWRREEPPGGGPVAGLAAGLDAVTAGVVVVLAVDLPYIEPVVPALLTRLDVGDAGEPELEVAVLVDAQGRRNFLAAAWRRAALQERLAAIGRSEGAAMRALYADARCAEVLDWGPDGGYGRDIDTPADLS
jgi:molybdopterin-guanine dinucleotide biosynthesis protein A